MITFQNTEFEFRIIICFFFSFADNRPIHTEHLVNTRLHAAALQLYCIRADLLPPDERCCYFSSTRNNCCEFCASDDGYVKHFYCFLFEI